MEVFIHDRERLTFYKLITAHIIITNTNFAVPDLKINLAKYVTVFYNLKINLAKFVTVFYNYKP